MKYKGRGIKNNYSVSYYNTYPPQQNFCQAAVFIHTAWVLIIQLQFARTVHWNLIQFKKLLLIFLKISFSHSYSTLKFTTTRCGFYPWLYSILKLTVWKLFNMHWLSKIFQLNFAITWCITLNLLLLVLLNVGSDHCMDIFSAWLITFIYFVSW